MRHTEISKVAFSGLRAAARAPMPVRECDSWDLTKLFPSQAAWEAERIALKTAATAAGRYKGRLGESGQTLLSFLQETSVLYERCERLNLYSQLHEYQDTRDDFFIKLSKRAEKVSEHLERVLVFTEPELLTLKEEELATLRNQSPGLNAYNGYFESLKRYRRHTRTESVEKILIEASRGAALPEEVFVLLGEKLPFKSFTIDGERFRVAQSTIDGLLAHPDREVRARAYKNYYAPYSRTKQVFAASLDAMADRAAGMTKVERFNSMFDQALFIEEVSRETYALAETACAAQQPLFRRYFTARAQLMGLGQCEEYDLYCGITPKSEPIPYDSAKELVLRALAPLGSDYVETATRGLHGERWVDVHPRPGKYQNPLATIANDHPFVMLTYAGSMADLECLAHELGHAMNFLETTRSQVFSDRTWTTVVAETAAIVNQFLLRDHLIKQGDAAQQLAVLDGAFYYYHRYLFLMPCLGQVEKFLHQAHIEESGVTAKELCAEMLKALKEGYGDTVKLDDKLASVKWATFCHFYDPFYFFQYAIATGAACVIAKKLIAGDTQMQAAYQRFLAAGSSVGTTALFASVGIDIASPTLFEPIFETVAYQVQLLEELAARGVGGTQPGVAP